MMRLKELCEEERPREKMLKVGAKLMTNAELIAILLRTGTGEKNVLELAQELLASLEGGLPEMAGWSVEKLCAFKGIGPSKAVSLAAALELGCRCTGELMKPQRQEIRNSDTVFKLLYPKMSGMDHEESWVLYLNRSNRLIAMEKASSGGLSETTIDIATIARKALEKKASALILSHNHPSGNPTPSQSDINMTAKLKKALSMLDISLVDHVVISEGCWYSFADEETRYYGENIASEGK